MGFNLAFKGLSEDLTTELHLWPFLWLDMAHESKHNDLILCSRVK